MGNDTINRCSRTAALFIDTESHFNVTACRVRAVSQNRMFPTHTRTILTGNHFTVRAVHVALHVSQNRLLRARKHFK